MGNYKKGIETRERIFASARREFKSKGYHKATIGNIAGGANVPVGLVNYYYKKNELLIRMYKDFLAQIREYVDNNIVNHRENALLAHIICTRIFFNSLFSSESGKRLLKEILEDGLLELNDELSRDDIWEIIKHFDIDISENLFHRLMLAELGARRELLLIDSLYTQTGLLNKELIDFLSTIAVRLAGVSPHTIAENIRQADERLASVDYSQIDIFGEV
ncbi:MAG: TetR/AcrR family transcriptional regulator [Eubacteriaceae bacterium]|nr:TetR/AcrR family transcriptional regulator [Eubacteriaceae bacterium]